MQKIISKLEEWFPPQLACDWDKQIGLQLGNRKNKVSKVLLSLDVTSKEVAAAIQNKCQLIVAHHALFFNPLSKINLNSPTGKCLEQLIKNDIGVYIIHTNMDAAPEIGLSALYAQQLGLNPSECAIIEETYREPLYKLVVFVPQTATDQVFTAISESGAGHIGNYSHCSFQTSGTGTFLPGANTKPHIGKPGQLERVAEIRIESVIPEFKKSAVIKAMLAAHPYEEVAYDLIPLAQHRSYGVGLVGTLPKPIKLNGKTIRRIGLCTGSGGSMIEAAKRLGAEAFYTGEANHHQQLLAQELGMELILEGHRQTEEIFMGPLGEKLKQSLGELEVEVYRS